MRIESKNSNLVGLQLSKTTAALSRALERLSSGKRVNSARDGAADFSTIIQLTSQVRGLAVSARNINQAQSLLVTADSAISSQIDLVQRMREIAVQASSGSLSSTDRQNLNTELQSLLEDFSRITNSTSFNETKLLDGSFGTKFLQLTANRDDQVSMRLQNLNSNEVFTRTIGTGSYSGPSTLMTSIEPDDIEVGDFNGDGNLDFAQGTGAVQTFVIMLGNGDGSFSAAATLDPLGDDATRMTSGDFDGDGILDLVGAGSSLLMYKGRGDGSFDPGMSISGNGSNVRTLKTLDLNNDGNLDVFSYEDGILVSILGNGDGTFQQAITQTLGFATSQAATLGDFNGDGILDLAAAPTGTGQIRIRFGIGDGTFQTASLIFTAGAYTDLISVDIDGDGDEDIVSVSTSSNTLNVFANNGTGTFSFFGGGAATIGTASSSIRSGDINQDGIADIIVSDSSGIASILIGNGNGSFQTRVTATIPSGNGRLELADFNNDGVLDILSNGLVGVTAINLGLSTEIAAVTEVNVSTQTKAQALLEILDDALENLNGARSEIGALHNRLDFTAGANLLLSETLEEARSKTEDVDVVMETTELVRLQILQQAQIAVMAQSNLQVQTVLALLR